MNIDVDGRKTAAGRASANSAVHVVVGYIVIVGSRMGVGNAHCTVVASCGFRTFQDTYLDKALLMLKTVGSGGSGGKGWKPAWQTGEVKVHVTWN